MNHPLKIYAAPLQGFTDRVWRNAHHEVWGGIDAYYAPFMRVTGGEIPHRDVAEALPQNNTAPLRPQILASPPAQAVMMAQRLRDMGHECIDINLGCPHPPIALKGKGSGMLARPAECQAMLEALAQIEGVAYSVKMRLGYDKPTQWKEILPLLDIIQPQEIVVHPRIGKQLYKGALAMDEFAALATACHYPIVFNGDITEAAQIEQLKSHFPALSGIMVGRHLIAQPDFFSEEKSVEKLMQFHQLLFSAYSSALTGGDHQVLSKMKALWEMMLPDADKKARKLIKKSSDLTKYQAAVNLLFSNLNLK
ncbi:MAG: tRNA-dihydrouridine synthase family protein [Bacteroidales bacterium]|nr:tRNA-dihydrouridine synthase family protein [Bacteroidales bacterium]